MAINNMGFNPAPAEMMGREPGLCPLNSTVPKLAKILRVRQKLR